MSIIQDASIIITDRSCKFDDLMRSLKAKIKKGEDSRRPGDHLRFCVLAGDRDMEMLQKLIKSGSQLNNENKEDRGFLLGSLYQHLSPLLWTRVKKENFRQNYIN